MKTIWITDPGHAWLRVSYKALADVGMGVSNFSRYSYYSASEQCVWLEEDCDAPKYLARLPADQRQGYGEIHLYTISRNVVRRQRHIGDVE